MHDPDSSYGTPVSADRFASADAFAAGRHSPVRQLSSSSQAVRAKVFLEGRYRKLSRDLPQTVFFCPECKGHPRRRRGCARCEGFGKLTRDSVQELIGWVIGKAFGTRKHKFHGAGREDVDVRMLGDGRPFVLELQSPRVFQVDLAALEAEINRRNAGRLEVLGLHWTEKERIVVLKETPHAKEYSALVEVEASGERAVEALARARTLIGARRVIVQHTPERVAHRRADRDRERWIEVQSIEPEVVDPSAFARRATGARVAEPDDESVVDAEPAVDVESSVDAEPVSAAESVNEPESAVAFAPVLGSASAAAAGSDPDPHSASLPERVPSVYWRVRLRTQHGTYVKEVLSGDSGKTRPCLSEHVGVPCRCVELDVTAILGENGENAASATTSHDAAAARSGFGAGL